MVMNKLLLTGFVVSLLSACVAVPVPSENQPKWCNVPSQKMTLAIVDVAEATNSFRDVGGYLFSPILIPVTAIVSGSYVAANNLYHLGQKHYQCQPDKGGAITPKQQ